MEHSVVARRGSHGLSCCVSHSWYEMILSEGGLFVTHGARRYREPANGSMPAPTRSTALRNRGLKHNRSRRIMRSRTPSNRRGPLDNHPDLRAVDPARSGTSSRADPIDIARAARADRQPIIVPDRAWPQLDVT